MQFLYGIIKPNKGNKFKYGLNKRKNPFYKLKLLRERKDFLIASKKPILEDTFVVAEQISDKMNIANIIKIIGPVSDFESQINIRLQELRVVKRGRWSSKTTIMSSLIDHTTFSVDPKGCIDIDDAMSRDNDYIYIHIAQPILRDMSDLKFDNMLLSSVYTPLGNIHMYENFVDISLRENTKRRAHTFKFNKKTHKYIGYKKTIILNKNAYSYDNIPSEVVEYMHEDGFKDSHKWIEYWMTKVNKTIAQTWHYIIYRRTSLLPSGDDSVETGDNDELSRILSKQRAYYTLEKTKHSYFDDFYTHATSPIRRIVDTLVLNNIKITQEHIDIINNWERELKMRDREWTTISFINGYLKKDIRKLKVKGIFIQNIKETEIYNRLQFYILEHKLMIYVNKFPDFKFEEMKEYDLELYFKEDFTIDLNFT
jgi:hypothetical protein